MAAPLPTRMFTSSICHACRRRLLPQQIRRTFRTSSTLNAAGDDALKGLSALSNNIASSSNRRERGVNSTATTNSGSRAQTGEYLKYLDNDAPDAADIFTAQAGQNLNAAMSERPHRLHVYSTKHNTHLTLVQPPRSAAQTPSSTSTSAGSSASQNKTIDVLLSISSGNIGFRKAGRGSYDAAYQLTAFMIKTMREKGISNGIKDLEVVLRGFGAGREAVTKVLLGSEGRNLRTKICKVVDATRLKLGGPRSKKPRRLG